MDIESTENVDIDEDDLPDAWCIFFIHKMMETGGNSPLPDRGPVTFPAGQSGSLCGSLEPLDA